MIPDCPGVSLDKYDGYPMLSIHEQEKVIKLSISRQSRGGELIMKLLLFNYITIIFS